MRKPLAAASVVAVAVAAVAFVIGEIPGILALAVGVAITVALVSWSTPHLGVALLDRLILALRTIYWRDRQGRHHAFGGVSLDIEDDGRHVWVDGDGLQRVLGTSDAVDVLAARHAGRWRRRDDGELMLRVDSVVERLASAPNRLDARIVRLRRYFERDVLHPAAERRRRSRGG